MNKHCSKEPPPSCRFVLTCQGAVLSYYHHVHVQTLGHCSLSLLNVSPLLPSPTARRAARIDFVGGEGAFLSRQILPVRVRARFRCQTGHKSHFTSHSKILYVFSNISSVTIQKRWSRASSTAFNGSFKRFFEVSSLGCAVSDLRCC